MIEHGEGDNASDDLGSSALSGRRDAIKKVGLAAGVAGAAWAAPTINGMSVVPAVAGAQTSSPPIVVGATTSGNCVTKFGGCYSGVGGTIDSYGVDLGGGGYWNFDFNGCGGSESVRLEDIPVGNTDNYKPPAGYKCKMILHNGNTGAQIYDTGYVNNPINGIADTSGVIFITPAQFPNGQNKVCVVIKCDPV